MKKNNYRLLATVAALWLTGLFSVGSDHSQLAPLASAGATFVVNTTTDSVDAAAGDGNCADSAGMCSLRAAIMESNALAGADIITLPVGTYTTTLSGGHEDNNLSGDLDINSDVTINGAGSGSTIVQANASPGVAFERVFHCRFVAPSAVIVINDITIRHGRYVVNTNGAGLRVDAGAANVTLNRVVVTDSQISNNGGGIAVSSATGARLTVNDSTISNNTAGGTNASQSRGGGIYLSSNNVLANISGSRISGNMATNTSTTEDVLGGGIAVRGTGNVMNISNSVVSNNTASSSGFNAFGGGVYVDEGTTTITGSTIRKNVSTTSSPQTGTGFAGGIFNSQSTVNITNSLVDDNDGNIVGGIETIAGDFPAATNITDSTIRRNGTFFEGGGVANFSVGSANSVVTITRSTINANAGSFSDNRGAGLANRSFSTGAATTNLTNSTVSLNFTGYAGGIYNSGSTATVNLNYCTVAHNSAVSGDGGGLYQDPSSGGTINLKNSIVGNNSAGATGSIGPDIFGTITSQNYNHVENTAGGTFTAMANDVTGTDPEIDFIANNGGPTLTQMPDDGSPVLNTIPNGTSDCGTIITFDQRGTAFIRPSGGACDKGSVERQPLPPLVLTEAASWKTHGSKGLFPVNLPLTGAPIHDDPGVECRRGPVAGEHTLVLTFSNELSSVDSVSASARTSDGTQPVSSSGSTGSDAHEYIVDLSGVPNASYITVTLNDVQDEFGQVNAIVSLTMGVLLGDVDGSGVVTVSDTNLTKDQALKPVTDVTFRMDVNSTGNITTADTNAVKSRALSRLP